jgi:hypothetical protein
MCGLQQSTYIVQALSITLKKNANDFILQILPCMGLNLQYREIINETFIIGKLLDALKAFNF